MSAEDTPLSAAVTSMYPMIIGLGSDLIDITRIERTLERFGDRYVQRCFTEVERAKTDRRSTRAASKANR